MNLRTHFCTFAILFIVSQTTLAWKIVFDEDHPVFKTKLGSVKGTTMRSRSKRTFAAFRGIPYAKPPTGDLRFRAPVPPDRWDEVYDATRDANVCVQQNYLFSQHPVVEGSEDCLYLNVYTPKLTSHSTNCGKLMPVMVFIHYGAFFAGSSRSDLLGPDYFMDENVILVTFNYRLGVLGFLSTYDDAAPGNWGYKDQVAALRWVRDNIIYFGGDNERVTLFGQSAGGGSTHHHMLSPMSKGLFQAAITQSGSALALWAKPQTVGSAVIAQTQAFFVGCRNDTDSYTMIDCLRTIPAEQLILSAEQFRFMRSEPLTVFSATIERKSNENPEPFITKDPLEIIQDREYHNVPWIIGVAADEGILRVAPFVRQHDLLQQINDRFDLYLPNMLALGLSVSEDELADTLDAVKKYYLPDSVINTSDSSSIQGFIDLYSDRAFTYAAYQSALIHAWKGHKQIWFYKFEYRGKLSYGDVFAATNETVDFDWGVSHCDDLLYLFSSPKLFPPLPKEDLEMSKTMIKLFTTFAIHKKPASRWYPIPDISDNQEVKNEDLHYLRIYGPARTNGSRSTVRLEMATGFLKSRMSFWKALPLSENIDGLN